MAKNQKEKKSTVKPFDLHDYVNQVYSLVRLLGRYDAKRIDREERKSALTLWKEVWVGLSNDGNVVLRTMRDSVQGTQNGKKVSFAKNSGELSSEDRLLISQRMDHLYKDFLEKQVPRIEEGLLGRVIKAKQKMDRVFGHADVFWTTLTLTIALGCMALIAGGPIIAAIVAGATVFLATGVLEFAAYRARREGSYREAKQEYSEASKDLMTFAKEAPCLKAAIDQTRIAQRQWDGSVQPKVQADDAQVNVMELTAAQSPVAANASPVLIPQDVPPPKAATKKSASAQRKWTMGIFNNRGKDGGGASANTTDAAPVGKVSVPEQIKRGADTYFGRFFDFFRSTKVETDKQQPHVEPWNIAASNSGLPPSTQVPMQ